MLDAGAAASEGDAANSERQRAAAASPSISVVPSGIVQRTTAPAMPPLRVKITARQSDAASPRGGFRRSVLDGRVCTGTSE